MKTKLTLFVAVLAVVICLVFSLQAQEAPLPESPGAKAAREAIKKNPYDSVSLYNLATWTQHGGQGVKQDIPAAISLFKRSAALGNLTSVEKLSDIYMKGLPGLMKPDSEECLKWAKRAAAQGNHVPLLYAASAMARGSYGWNQDLDQASAILSSLETGQSHILGGTLGFIALSYTTGIEGKVKPNGKKAIENHLLAEKKYPEIKHHCYQNIATIYRNGAGGVKQDHQKWYEWELKSVKATLNHVNKRNKSLGIAEVLEKGEGNLEPDLAQAWAWYAYGGSLGADYGENKAKELTKKMTKAQVDAAQKRLEELKEGKFMPN